MDHFCIFFNFCWFWVNYSFVSRFSLIKTSFISFSPSISTPGLRPCFDISSPRALSTAVHSHFLPLVSSRRHFWWQQHPKTKTPSLRWKLKVKQWIFLSRRLQIGSVHRWTSSWRPWTALPSACGGRCPGDTWAPSQDTRWVVFFFQGKQTTRDLLHFKKNRSPTFRSFGLVFEGVCENKTTILHTCSI